MCCIPRGIVTDGTPAVNRARRGKPRRRNGLPSSRCCRSRPAENLRVRRLRVPVVISLLAAVLLTGCVKRPSPSLLRPPRRPRRRRRTSPMAVASRGRSSDALPERRRRPGGFECSGFTQMSWSGGVPLRPRANRRLRRTVDVATSARTASWASPSTAARSCSVGNDGRRRPVRARAQFAPKSCLRVLGEGRSGGRRTHRAARGRWRGGPHHPRHIREEIPPVRPGCGPAVAPLHAPNPCRLRVDVIQLVHDGVELRHPALGAGVELLLPGAGQHLVAEARQREGEGGTAPVARQPAPWATSSRTSVSAA